MMAAGSVPAQAQLAGSTVTSTAGNGFSSGTAGNICKSASASRSVSNGGELVNADWTGGCVGYYSVDFSNAGFVLTVLEGGNYSYSNLNMMFAGAPMITGASFLGYSGNFFASS